LDFFLAGRLEFLKRGAEFSEELGLFGRIGANSNQPAGARVQQSVLHGRSFRGYERMVLISSRMEAAETPASRAAGVRLASRRAGSRCPSSARISCRADRV